MANTQFNFFVGQSTQEVSKPVLHGPPSSLLHAWHSADAVAPSCPPPSRFGNTIIMAP